jgi:ribosomal protein S8
MKKLPTLLAKIKVGIFSRLKVLRIKYSKPWVEVLNLLYNQGYIQNYYVSLSENKFYVFFRYFEGRCTIQTLQVLSRSSQPLYIKKKELWKFSRNSGSLVISTKQGLLTHEDCLKLGLGGKLLFYVS